MSLVEKFTNRVDFDTYEDFHANFKINVPENFNFAYDIIDEYAYCGYINWNGERIEDIERFLDLYLQWEAADEEKSV